MIKVKISTSQYNDLLQGLVFINKYDLSFRLLCEMNRYWKELAFDIMEELQKQNVYVPAKLDYFKENYKKLIEQYKLNIDLEGYIELFDYITIDEWQFLDESNVIEWTKDGIFLKKKNDEY